MPFCSLLAFKGGGLATDELLGKYWVRVWL